MLKVGVPDTIDRALQASLPKDVDVVVLAEEMPRPVEVDFWVVPPYQKAAEAMWRNLRGVRVAQSTLAGVDWLVRLVPGEVTVCDARGVHDISTAEWVVATTLAMVKYLPFYGGVQRAGEWKRRFEASGLYNRIHGAEREFYPPVMLEDLHGKRVLIVGYGSIGSMIERMMQPFGVSVDRIARTAREGVRTLAALPELLPLADVVVLIVPLTGETRGMMGAQELGLMKQGALLVNAARGPVVDTDALLAALHAGRIRAALDVTDPEPLPDGHALWSAPNALITPHVAGSSPGFMPRAMDLAGEQIRRMQRGEAPINIVTGEY
ncbi:MAG: 2-hydroxyacid dehydrogenase [Acidobacteriaceae bacterium]